MFWVFCLRVERKLRYMFKNNMVIVVYSTGRMFAKENYLMLLARHFKCLKRPSFVENTVTQNKNAGGLW